jgi:hypothetical protein
MSASAFVRDREEAVEFEDGSRVWIKAKMSYRDRRRLAAAAMAKPDVAENVAEAAILVLEVNVLRWEGPLFSDELGQPCPLTRDNLDALDPEIADEIVSAINARNPTSPLAGRKLARTSSPSISATETPSPSAPASSSSADATAGPGTSS